MHHPGVNSIARSLIGAVLLAATVSAGPVQAGADVSTVHVLSPHRDLFDLAIDQDRWIAVGALGSVLESEDGGRIWTDQSLDTQLALLSVATDRGQSVGVGQMGLVAIRSNGAWTMRQAPTRERLLAVATELGGPTWAVGAFGTMLVSEDAGVNWRFVDIDWTEFDPAGNEPHLYDVHLERERILVVGEFGMVLESTDGGDSWRLARRGDESLFALHVHGQTTYAVGQNGIVIRRKGPGSAWEKLQTGVIANLLGISQRDGSGDLVVAGMRSVLRSSDGGDSWTAIKADDFSRSWYGDAAWSRSMNGFVIVGGRGQIKLIDGYK